jgi:hypothetical protein
MRQTSCRIFRINKNIAIISEFTVPLRVAGHDGCMCLHELLKLYSLNVSGNVSFVHFAFMIIFAIDSMLCDAEFL